MKLGTQTASMTNHILSRATVGQPKPVVGMGATVLCWTDRHAATITKVETRPGKLGGVFITVQRDRAKRTDKNGFSESQQYEYAPDPNVPTLTYRRLASGQWQRVELNSRTNRY